MTDINERVGILESKIDSVNTGVQDVKVVMTNFTQGIGSTVQEHDRDISGIKVTTANNKDHIAWVSKKVDKNMAISIMIFLAIIGWIIIAVQN